MHLVWQRTLKWRNLKLIMKSSLVKKSTHWIVAMNEETESLQKNHTWQLVEKPKNQNIVG